MVKICYIPVHVQLLCLFVLFVGVMTGVMVVVLVTGRHLVLE